MKNKYDIRINPTPLSNEEIAQRKNFDALMEAYQQHGEQQPARSGRVRMLYRIAAIAAAVLLGWLSFNWIFSENKLYQKQADAFFAEQPYVNVPPVPAAKPSFVSRSVDANAGGKVLFNDGSSMMVPADAFEDSAGQPVTGEVEIRFREMHDYIDFFLSGIPMVYDSAQTRYTFESAGMLEIYAEQNGKHVKLRPGKSIDVELVSELQMPHLEIPPGYNIYKLDTTARKWVYQDIDRMQLVETQVALDNENHPLYRIQQEHAESLAAINRREEAALLELERSLNLPPAPQEPRFYDPNAFVFDFDIADIGQDVQLPYQSSLWQLSPGQNIDATQLNKNWEGMQLEALDSRDFQLDLIGANETLSVVVMPVLSGTAYEEAMARYRLDVDYYQQLVAERESVLENRRAEIKNEFALERATKQSEFQYALEAFEDEDQLEEAPMMRHKIINRFTANSFGIWNCDRPVAPEIASVKGRFMDESGRTFTNNLAFLVDKSRNTIDRIYLSDVTEFQLNTNSKNLMWIITEENQIAVFRPEDFEKLNFESDEQDFVFQVSDRVVDTETDLREILYF